jgi:hypothetical protein
MKTIKPHMLVPVGRLILPAAFAITLSIAPPLAIPAGASVASQIPAAAANAGGATSPGGNGSSGGHPQIGAPATGQESRGHLEVPYGPGLIPAPGVDTTVRHSR